MSALKCFREVIYLWRKLRMKPKPFRNRFIAMIQNLRKFQITFYLTKYTLPESLH